MVRALVSLREQVTNKVETSNNGGIARRFAPVLLLFNLATLSITNKASNLRFQFEGFKTERWTLIAYALGRVSARPLRLTVQRE